MKHQTKKASLIEAVVSNVIGFVLTVGAMLIVNPDQPLVDNLTLSSLLLVLHIFRSYWVRRAFNAYASKRAKATKAAKRRQKRGRHKIEGAGLDTP